MREFSRWQFVVLGRKRQVFNTVNQKNNFQGTLGCLKRGNQWVHSEEIPVGDCVKAKHVRSQTRSANRHYMSCRRSRKFLCVPWNPLYKILQVWMWILRCFMLNWSICHFSNSLAKFSKNVLSLIESRNCGTPSDFIRRWRRIWSPAKIASDFRHRLMRTHLTIFFADRDDVALQPCSRAPSRSVLNWSHVIKSPNLISWLYWRFAALSVENRGNGHTWQMPRI